MSASKLFLVPVDFTPASISAAKFSIGLIQNPTDEIALLHVVKNNIDISTEKVKLENFAKEHLPSNVRCSTHVVSGKVAETIGKFAKATKASLVVLGTHCKTGLGKLFNSYAFQIVEHSRTPFIMVQEETNYKAIKKIVMTIDSERESTQIIKTAVSFGQLFDAEIILVAAKQTDAELKAKADRNLFICNSYFNEHNVRHSIKFVDSKNFVDNIFKLSEELEADLIAATYYQQHVHVFTDSFVRTLANNELHIPLLTMEHESTYSGGQFGAMFG